ncbi:hypothetical protein CLOP_g3913 [Closterium sp. NIES-67]|nr:hypothetical protein CLOP_g3913 [Closterium sp. NIES-67]
MGNRRGCSFPVPPSLSLLLLLAAAWLVLLLLLPSPAVAARIDDAQAAVLVECAAAWGRTFSGWQVGGECSTAQFISCDGAGLVTAMWLDGRGLVGSIPTALGTLTSLTALQQLQEGRDLGAGAAVCLDCKWEKSDIRSPISVMGDFLVSLLPGHVSASFSCVRVPAADGICDSDVTDPDGSGTAVSEGEVGLVAVYGAVDGGLLGDYKVSISGHPYALVPQGIMGVSPSVPGATPEQVCKWVGLVKGGVRCRTASARGPPDAAGRAAKRPWAWVRLLPSTRTPSVLKGMPGGRRSGAGCSADHAAHFAGLWERPMRSMAAVKLRNAEVQASGSPTKVMSSAYARQRTSGAARLLGMERPARERSADLESTGDSESPQGRASPPASSDRDWERGRLVPSTARQQTPERMRGQSRGRTAAPQRHEEKSPERAVEIGREPVARGERNKWLGSRGSGISVFLAQLHTFGVGKGRPRRKARAMAK